MEEVLSPRKPHRLTTSFLLNIRGMMPGVKNQRWKKHELEGRIEQISEDTNVPFFVLTETHLKSYVKDAEVNIQGYGLVRGDRVARSQGGVIIYYQDHLSATKSQCFSNKVCEIAMTFIAQLKVIVVAIYRPPNTELAVFQEALSQIDQYLHKNAANSDCDVMLMGDLNFPNVDWTTESVTNGCTKNDKECFKALQLVMTDHFLIQTVNLATRVNNTLDVILTNNSELIKKIDTEDTIMSDHRFVKCYLGYRDTFTKPEEKECRTGFNALNLHKADWDRIIEKLRSINWDEVFATISSDSTEALPEDERRLKAFCSKVLEICAQHAPLRSSKRKKRRCDHRAALRRRRRTTTRLEEVELNHPDSPKIEKLKQVLVDIELEIRDSIQGRLKKNEEELIDQIDVNSKVFYAVANSKRTTKQRVGPLEDPENNNALTNDILRMLEIFANQYVKVFSDPNTNVPDPEAEETDIEGANFLVDIIFSPKDIEEAINELQTDAAAGPDDFPAMVLKKCKECLSEPLHKLWRISLDTGTIPKSLLTQKIIPVFKKGSKTEAQNYRPVSLTSHLIKVFERVVRKSIVTFLEENNKLSDQQHGFRKTKSCLTQLLSHVETIINMLSKGGNADVIYLDFAKAFDKVSHKILLMKLRKIGIRGKLLEWIRNFLNERYQCVSLEGKISFWRLVLSGVPQGTVLGPLLFIIFIDDIYEVVKNSVARSFADDTRLTMLIKDILDQMKLQADLEAVTKWAADNNMALHEGKFELIQHGKNEDLKRENGHQYELSDGKTIETSSAVKDLGIIIDEQLNWTNQVTDAAQQAAQTSAWVLRTFTTRDKRPLMILFKSLIRPKLDYCCPVWLTSKKGDLCKLESVQRSFTARIWSLKEMNYWERLKELNLMSIQRRRERYIIIHTWKIFSGAAPNDLGLVFQFNDRLGLRCLVPTLTSKSAAVNSLKDQSFTSMGPRLFNKIPREVKENDTLASFKRSLDQYLMSLPDTPTTPGYPAVNNSVLDLSVTNHGRASSELLS